MKKQKGFSLIELLIVVGIIGALTAIAVPAYSKYKLESDAKAGVASVKNLLTKAELHIAANNTNTLATFADALDPDEAAGEFKVGALGKITGTAATTGDDAVAGTLVFTFDTEHSSFGDKKITFTRNAEAWKCVAEAEIITAAGDIDGCNAPATP
ncbi:Fimbrial protein precursor [Grimontia celer]|uniref:Fimbrial protein n=1 Tax=Grimontia celer TaxID=1796497 RepID=A0A128F9S2_9GAMM|nr:prepilin-type N-terminal cleavage/methylation domain-containing protein [Grimontia celer]CZF83563.1 Fimbrial protein precursor [Grimontia celer]